MAALALALAPSLLAYSMVSSSNTGACGAGSANVAKVAFKTRRCCATSPGAPIVEPRLSLVNVARGGLVTRVRPAFQLVSVVAIPDSSKPRAISPTD
jgi:hypothetical protein